MAKKGDKKTAAPQEDTITDSILDHFGAVGEPVDSGKKADAVTKTDDKGGKDDDAKALADLQKQVGELTEMGTKHGDTIERLQNLNMQLMAGKGAVGDVITAPEASKVDMSGLPSAADDPDGFSKGLNERLGKAISESVGAITTHERAVAAQANERSSRTQGLWDEFTELHPELDDYQDYVEVAATRVAKRAQRRGLDLDTYMFKGSDQFLSDVAEEANKIVKPLLEKGKGEEGNKGEEGEKGEGEKGEEGADRTGGIFGGLDGQEGGGPSAEAEGLKTDSLLKDLEDIQRKTGYY